ncbi:MAG: tail fiber domain-containing protein [Verrucomicrobiota bacterium]
MKGLIPHGSIPGLLFCLFFGTAAAETPSLLNHQGRMIADGTAFDGTGQFKFALVNVDGTQSYWSNDGTSAAGSEPTAAVSVTVDQGLYAVLLGDSSLVGMMAFPSDLFQQGELWLRVWFNDGVNGSQQIVPDQRLATVPYAMTAARVDQVLLDDVVARPLDPVVSWGSNSSGQATTPSVLESGEVTAVSAGAEASLALLSDGTVAQWGNGTPPGGLTDVIGIAAGASHYLAVRSDGTVTAWGDNSYSQATVPGGITDAIAVAAGEKHSLILHEGGTVTAFGDNTFQQTSIPGGLADVVAIAAGADHSLALKADKTVVAWGRNEAGQTNVPPSLSNVQGIAAGSHHGLAVREDGSVVAWGWDIAGQATIPSGLTGVTAVSGGYAFSVALKDDGSVVAWGDNTSLQLDVPEAAKNVVGIAAGGSHVLVLRASLVPAELARLDQPNRFSRRIGVGREAVANTLEVEGNASKSTAGNWLANSDRRIKTDIHPVSGSAALEKLDEVNLVEFRYTGEFLQDHPDIKDRRYLNVIAQEFAEVFPEHVQMSGESLPDGSGILQVDTYPLTIYSAAAVRELHRQLKEKDAEIDELRERLEAIERALAKE